MQQVALAHERCYLQPPRRSKAERIAGTHLPLPVGDDVDRHSTPTTVRIPLRDSRKIVDTKDIPGLALAIRAWQALEWKNPLCPPSGVPETVECCNFIVLPMKPGETAAEAGEHIVHASEMFYDHPWHDSVLTGGRNEANEWVPSCWMCRCRLAFLFRLPDRCKDKKLMKGALHLGKRKGWHLPMLLVTYMCPFWPFDKRQNAACLPPWLKTQKKMPRYADDNAMRQCGKFLRRYTNVQAWIGAGGRVHRACAAHRCIMLCVCVAGLDPRRQPPGGHGMERGRAEGAP